MPFVPFQKLEQQLAAKKGVKNPAGLAAYIARKKFGNVALETAAKNHTSLEHAKVLHGKGHSKRRKANLAAFTKGR